MLRLILPIIVAVIVALSIDYFLFSKVLTLQKTIISVAIFTLLWLAIYKFFLPDKKVSKNQKL